MVSEVEEDISTEPVEGDRCLKIDGDESRPARRRYRWVIYKRRFGWDSDDLGWYQDYEEGSFTRLEGYARTMRSAEYKGRVALVQFQLTAPRDPGMPGAIWIEA